MAKSNVELLRLANEAFNRGDIEGVLALCGEDVELKDLNNAPDVPRVTHGKEEARQVFAAWTDGFEDFLAEIEEYIDVDERHVGCVVHYRGKQRGLEVDIREVDMWEVRENKLIRGILGYPDRKSALADLGRAE